MEVMKDLTCPICLEFFTHPVILPCSHVLCRRPCAENICQLNFMRCPVCRDSCYISGGITSLPRVLTLESIIDKVRAERKRGTLAGKPGSDVTSHNTSRKDILADAKFGGRCLDASLTLTSPEITSHGSHDQSGFKSTLTSKIAQCTLGQSAILQQFNLQLNNSIHKTLVTSNLSLSSDRTIHRLGTSSSPLDQELHYMASLPCNNEANIGPTHTGEITVGTSNYHGEMPGEAIITSRKGSTSETSSNRQEQTIQTPTFFSYSEQVQDRFRKFRTFQSNLTDISYNNLENHNLLSSAVAGLAGRTAPVSPSNPALTSRHNNPLNSVDNDNVSSDGGVTSDIDILRIAIQENIQRICDVQCQLLMNLTSYKEKIDALQALLEKSRLEVNTKCDSLMATLEHKRSSLLGRIDRPRARPDDVTAATEKLLRSTQHLAGLAHQLLEAGDDVLAETAPSLLERLSSSAKQCQLCLHACDLRVSFLLSHPVDVRNERTILTDADSLKALTSLVPSKPIIDVQRCTRNNDSVALVLDSAPDRHMIDSYEIIYCSEEQTHLNTEERFYAKLPADTTPCPTREAPLDIVLIENLCNKTHYYFSTRATNKLGRSCNSDHVQCWTLDRQDCLVPVPTILESSCKISSHHVTLCCPSPAHVTIVQDISYFLLYRYVDKAYVWRAVELRAMEYHRIDNLLHDTEYQFAVLACNGRGECQISQKISLKTNLGSF